MLEDTFRERLFPINIISGMLELAAKNEIPTEELLLESGIDLDVIGNENSHISNNQVGAIILGLWTKIDDPAFGLRLGESIHKSIQSIAGPFFSSSESLRVAFDKLMLYQDLIIPIVELYMEENDDYVDICMKPYEENIARNIFNVPETLALYTSATETVLSGVWVSSQQFLSKDFKIIQAGFKYPAPSYAKDYEDIFACEVLFEQDKNYLRIDKSLFDKKLYSSLPAIHKQAEAAVEQRLKKLKKSEAILNAVKDFVKEHVSDENLNLDSAAKKMHMTGRTLQRALRMENTSFLDIRDNVRSEISRYYLEHTSMSIEEISDHVGFSDASGFYTAFKRWHGVSPGSVRNSPETK